LAEDASSDLQSRIDRLESIDEIRQLAAKYSLALDMRDADAWVNLFPADVRVNENETGRGPLRRWFDETMRTQFSGTSHHIGGHIMQMMYFDRYERIDGRWYFRRRLPLYWYASDINKPPVGDCKMRWPGREPYDGSFHDLFPSWEEFWSKDPQPDAPVAPPAPLEKFIETMRRGKKPPSVRVR
jgi:hypothetical protein